MLKQMSAIFLATVMTGLITAGAKRPEPVPTPGPAVKAIPLKPAAAAKPVDMVKKKEEPVAPQAKALARAQERINFFTATFKLVVKEKDSNKVQLDADGKLWLAGNRRYRVDYEQPQKQTLVSNGKKRWLYLKAINQVQVQSMPPEGNPAEFFLELGGGLSRLLKHCDVKVEAKKDYELYTLTPRDGKSGFDQARIWTNGKDKLPYRLEVDAEKIVTVKFSSIQTKLDEQKMNEQESARFEFIFPKDAEVIEMLW